STPDIYTLSLHDALPICRKNSITATTSSSASTGIPTPALTPIWLAAAMRGKFVSRVASRTQTGCFEVHTRPGKPSPGLNLNSSRSEEHTSELQSRFDLVC